MHVTCRLMMQPQCGVSSSRLNWYIEVVVAHGARNTVARQEGTQHAPCIWMSAPLHRAP